jgi:hypothetical protein
VSEDDDNEFVDWSVVNLGAPRHFFASLASDDDWTFIIKLHALLEASLNHLLLVHFNNPAMEGIITRLDTSDPQRGKIAFIKACELLPDELRQFVIQLSKLRNKLVHDVKNFGLTISDYEKTFDEKQFKVWTLAIGDYHPDPKVCIFGRVLNIVGIAQATQKNKQIESKLSQAHAVIIKRWIAEVEKQDREAHTPKEQE